MVKGFQPACIDISVTCMHCGNVLYTGIYTPDIIAKLKIKIRKERWVHHPMEGTLCPECAARMAEKEKKHE